MADRTRLTILQAQQQGKPLPTVVDADDDEQRGMVDEQASGSFVARAAGWCLDSDGDYDDD